MQEAETREAVFAPEPFEFTGKGSEYFGIWIVNLVLSILTLGIYSAWAKVRRQKYFYQHTRVAGGGFDYHGDPISILKGRLLAFGLLVAYSLAKEFPGWPLVVAIVLIIVIAPLLLRSALRFRLHNSSYRGLRFTFRGGVGESYILFFVYGLFTLVTAYLAAPLFHQRLKRYQHGRSWFGKTPFHFSAGVGSFFGVYLVVIGMVIAAFIGAAFLVGGFASALAQLQQGQPDPASMVSAMVTIFALIFLLSMIIGPLFQSRIGNLIWNNTQLGESRFESRLRFWPLFLIYTTNFLMILLTLGLFIPWAAVRVTRYRAECLSFLPAVSDDEFVAETGEEVTASGEEMTEMFDFDIGL